MQTCQPSILFRAAYSLGSEKQLPLWSSKSL
jgi:hypothetical protein